MKKLVFVINNFLIGGVEKFLLDLIRGLDKEKFSITIVAVWGKGPLFDEFKKLNVLIKLYGYNSIFTKLILLPVTFLRLTGFLIKSKPDIVITSLWEADVLGIFSSWLAGVKKRICIHHDIEMLSSFRRKIKIIFCIKLCTNIIAISNNVKEFLIKHWKAQNVSVIYNGVDINYWDNIPSNSGIGVIARLEPVKGHIEFLKALKNVNNPPKTYFIGDGSLKDELEQYVKNNNLNVEFLGYQKDIRKALGLIDIVVIPSIREGFGLTAIEAMFAGKIVLGSKAVAEILPKELVYDDLTDLFNKVLKNKEYYKKISQQWVAENRERFDVGNTVKEYEKFL